MLISFINNELNILCKKLKFHLQYFSGGIEVSCRSIKINLRREAIATGEALQACWRVPPLRAQLTPEETCRESMRQNTWPANAEVMLTCEIRC